MLSPKTARTNMPLAECLVPAAGLPPADAATWGVPQAAAPATLTLLGLWPLSLLANLSLLAMGSTPPLEMSSSTVPTVALHPFWWAPWWTSSPGARCRLDWPDCWGHAPSFDAQHSQRCCPCHRTSHPCQRCQHWRRPPPLLRLRVPPHGRGGRNGASPPCAFLQGVPSAISGLLPLSWSLAAHGGFERPTLVTPSLNSGGGEGQ